MHFDANEGSLNSLTEHWARSEEYHAIFLSAFFKFLKLPHTHDLTDELWCASKVVEYTGERGESAEAGRAFALCPAPSVRD
jgi:hypothetical protein